MEENLLYSESIDLNVNLIKNDNNGTPKKKKKQKVKQTQKVTLTERCRITFDRISGHHGLAKVTHKISCHS